MRPRQQLQPQHQYQYDPNQPSHPKTQLPSAVGGGRMQLQHEPHQEYQQQQLRSQPPVNQRQGFSSPINTMSYMNSSNSSIGSNMNTSIDTANYPGSPATSQVSLSSQVTHVTRGSLLKRKDYLGVDQKAHSHPNRTYYYKNHDFDDIIDTCSKKLEIDAEDVKALFLRGSAYFKKRMFEAAVTDFNILLQHEPNNTEGLYQRGLALMKLNEYSAALDDFTVVLDRNPDHVNAAFSRATCYNVLGNFVQAIEDYNFALLKDDQCSSNYDDGSPLRLRSSSNASGSVVGAGGRFSISPPPRSLVDRTAVEDRGSYVEAPSYGSSKGMTNGDNNRTLDEGRYNPDAEDRYYSDHLAPRNHSNNGNNVSQGKINNGALNIPQIGMKSSFRNSVSYPSQPFESDFTDTQGRTNHNNAGGRDTFFNAVELEGYAPGTKSNNVAAGRPINQQMLEQSTKPAADSGTRNKGQSGGFTISAATFLSNTGSSATAPRNPLPSAPVTNNTMIQPHRNSTAMADEYHARGYQHRREGDFENAVKEYTRALDCDPQHYKALFNRGFAFDKLNKFDEAIADYSKSIDIDPQNPYCFYNRGISFDRMGNLEAAHHDFSKAISLLPNNADFHHNRAFCLRKMGKFEQAIKDYSEALRISPQHFKALYNRSYCLERLGRWEEALNDSNAALRIQPSHGGCLANRAVIYEQLENLTASLTDFESALHAGADPFPTLCAKAKVLAKMGNFTAAVKDLTAALEIQPNDLNVYFSRAMCFKSCENYKAAIHDFSRVLYEDHSQAMIFNHRGYCFRKVQKYKEAINDYTQSIELSNGDNVRAFNNRAYIYAKLEQHEAAIADYSKVIELDPENTHAYHNRGILFDKMGLIDQAIADFTKVLELDPQSTKTPPPFNPQRNISSLQEKDHQKQNTYRPQHQQQQQQLLSNQMIRMSIQQSHQQNQISHQQQQQTSNELKPNHQSSIGPQGTSFNAMNRTAMQPNVGNFYVSRETANRSPDFPHGKYGAEDAMIAGASSRLNPRQQNLVGTLSRSAATTRQQSTSAEPSQRQRQQWFETSSNSDKRGFNGNSVPAGQIIGNHNSNEEEMRGRMRTSSRDNMSKTGSIMPAQRSSSATPTFNRSGAMSVSTKDEKNTKTSVDDAIVTSLSPSKQIKRAPSPIKSESNMHKFSYTTTAESSHPQGMTSKVQTARTTSPAASDKLKSTGLSPTIVKPSSSEAGGKFSGVDEMLQRFSRPFSTKISSPAPSSSTSSPPGAVSTGASTTGNATNRQRPIKAAISAAKAAAVNRSAASSSGVYREPVPIPQSPSDEQSNEQQSSSPSGSGTQLSVSGTSNSGVQGVLSRGSSFKSKSNSNLRVSFAPDIILGPTGDENVHQTATVTMSTTSSNTSAVKDPTGKPLSASSFLSSLKNNY